MPTQRIGPRPSAYEAFKTLRNRIRKLRALEVIRHCLDTLNHPHASDLERVRHYRPWEILLLLKWTLLHGEFRDVFTRPMRPQEFDHLVNLTAEVFNCGRLPSEYNALPLFMRNMAYQQFWLQADFQGGGLARQSVIFGGLPENHGLRKAFRENVGLDIPDFVEMSVMLIPKLQDSSPVFNRKWFSSVAQQLAPGAVDAFLNALSVDIAGAITLAAEKRATDINWELYERTPFQARPVLKWGADYIPMSKVLLSRTLELFIYRFLRNRDPEQFMQTFGSLFERYVLRLLTYAGTPYWTEAQLKGVCPGRKVVDALIRDEDDNVLVDAKGIEFPEIGMITHLPEVVRDRAKPSVLKAIDQAYSTIAGLARVQEEGKPRLGPGKNYLFVVTMMDTFLGNGGDFLKIVGEEELTKIQHRHGGVALVPADQMYFVAVQDVEVLCKLVRDGATSFRVALRKAQHDDAAVLTKKFIFHQHLLDMHGEPDFIDFLNDEIDAIFARVEMRFPPDARGSPTS